MMINIKNKCQEWNLISNSLFHKTIVFACILFAISLIGLSHISAAENSITQRKFQRSATGVIEAHQSVVLAAKIMGRITTINFSIGQKVARDELLIKLDQRELKAELASALASVNLAETEWKYQQKRANRIKRLYKSKSISEDVLDESTFSASAAKAKLEIAQATVTKIKVLLVETEIRAPFPGFIIEKNSEIGAITEPGKALLKLENIQQLKIVSRIKEKDISHVKKGQKVQVIIDALDGLTLEGTIDKIIPSADPHTHAFAMEVLLPQQPNLYPGMFTKLKF